VRRDGPPRVVAILVPDLPLQRIARGREPAAGSSRPLAVVAEGRVLCRDAAAAAAGVRPGATLAEALAACGRLAHVATEAAADRAALRAVAEAMLALAPAVEVSAPDALLLDASAAHLLLPRARRGDAAPAGGGGAGAWPDGADLDAGRTAEELLARRALAVAAEMGYAARAAIATGRGPARALARHAAAPIVWVAPGCAAGALAALPVAALGLPPAVADRLRAVGVESAGALARLPEGTLAHRFGPEGVLAARLARGEDDGPLVPYLPETLPEEALDLEAPAESAEPLLFGLKRLADRVAARLAGRGLGASRLQVVLRLDPRGEERLAVPLAAPTAAPGRWLLPVKEHLFSLRLPAAVVGIRLAAVEVAPVAAEQLALADRPEALAALDGVLSRLSVRLGDGAIFAAEPVDRHRPEAAYRAVPFSARPRRAAVDPGGGRAAPLPAGGDGAPRPTRLLRVPAAVVAEGEGGRVTALRVDGRARGVLAMEGPERLRGEWWAGPFDRDYYRVRLEGLGDCWVYRDGGDGRLYLHGFFD
jgi:protein ImuB